MAKTEHLIRMSKIAVQLRNHGNQNLNTCRSLSCQPTKRWEPIKNGACAIINTPQNVYQHTNCGFHRQRERTLKVTKLLSLPTLAPKVFKDFEWSGGCLLATGPKLSSYPSVCVRPFHTTPRACVPPFIWMFVKPIAKVTAMLSGRFVRKWWQALPDKKRIFCKENVRKNWHWLTLGGVILSGLMYTYYRSHLQETPITRRVRFVAVTDEQFMKIAESEANMHMANFEGDILPVNHPHTKRVVELTRRLVSGNRDLPKMKDMQWTVTIVDRPDLNAFVLPTGDIFVFTGLLNIAMTDDQLAIVIGHELSHALLSHAAEQLSFMQLIDWMIIVVMAAIWTIMPTDGIAIVTQWFYHKVVDFVIHMPYSRKLEKEADKVGLHLCAKACFDVRASSAFWTVMDSLAKVKDGKVPEWLSTHPSHENRVKHLDFLIPKAIEERAACSCPDLPQADPRDHVKVIEHLANNMVRAAQTGINMKQVHVIAPDVPRNRIPRPKTA